MDRVDRTSERAYVGGTVALASLEFGSQSSLNHRSQSNEFDREYSNVEDFDLITYDERC